MTTTGGRKGRGEGKRNEERKRRKKDEIIKQTNKLKRYFQRQRQRSGQLGNSAAAGQERRGLLTLLFRFQRWKKENKWQKKMRAHACDVPVRMGGDYGYGVSERRRARSPSRKA